MSERPTIYVIDAAVAMTGALVAARHMAKALRGVAQMVLVLPTTSTLTQADVPEFMRVDYLPVVNPSKQRGRFIHYFAALLSASWKLRVRMRADGATQIVLNDFYLLHGLALRLFGFRGNIIQWVRCDPERFAGALAKPMLALVTRSANQVIAVSHFIQEKLPASAKTQMIYDAYTGDVTPVRATTGLEKIFLFIGNYIAGKGQDMALEAFAEALKHDPSLQLHFYGGDMGLAKNRAYRGQLAARAQALGITDKVVFGEFVTQTRPLLQTAYVALNFSDSESFSMTVLEASGASLPVIATRSGGPEEIIADGETGYLIPVRDVSAATQRMLDLAGNPVQAQAMGAAGATRVRELFSEAIYDAAIRRLLLG